MSTSEALTVPHCAALKRRLSGWRCNDAPPASHCDVGIDERIASASTSTLYDGSGHFSPRSSMRAYNALVIAREFVA